MYALTEDEGRRAITIARHTLEYALEGSHFVPEDLPPVFREKRGVFVTLKEEGELRGCIGIPYPVMELGEALVDAAECSGLSDPRFTPIRKAELSRITIEVTILSPPQLLLGSPEDRPRKIHIGTHGLIVTGMGCTGLLLPQVPAECGWDSREFLDHTCIKAGLRPDCWKRDEVEIYYFEGQIFHE
jgi:uncharacterized protein (TIGR00296 family)